MRWEGTLLPLIYHQSCTDRGGFQQIPRIYVRKRHISVAAIGLLLAACAKPLPPERLAYAGEWSGPGITLHIFRTVTWNTGARKAAPRSASMHRSRPSRATISWWASAACSAVLASGELPAQVMPGAADGVLGAKCSGRHLHPALQRQGDGFGAGCRLERRAIRPAGARHQAGQHQCPVRRFRTGSTVICGPSP